MSHDLSRYKHLLVFGGTFDPPHRAHLELPHMAMHQVGAEGVAYIPAGRSPFKVGRPQTSAEHRLAMLRLALADQPWALILTDELDRVAAQPDQPSYTIDTLEALRRRLGAHIKLRLLLGADQLMLFPRWHRAHRIIELAEPWVMVRPPATRASLLAQLPADQSPQVWSRRMLDLPVMGISSSEVRDRIAQGLPVRDMVAPAVEEYIRRHQLYGNP